MSKFALIKVYLNKNSLYQLQCTNVSRKRLDNFLPTFHSEISPNFHAKDGAFTKGDEERGPGEGRRMPPPQEKGLRTQNTCMAPHQKSLYICRNDHLRQESCAPPIEYGLMKLAKFYLVREESCYRKVARPRVTLRAGKLRALESQPRFGIPF